jgi:hypothetical protein
MLLINNNSIKFFIYLRAELKNQLPVARKQIVAAVKEHNDKTNKQKK